MRSYVTVDVDVDDVLSELSDSDLLEALASRRRVPGSQKEVGATVELSHIQDAYSALQRGDVEYAALILNRVLYPKWATPEEAAKAYMAATAGGIH